MYQLFSAIACFVWAEASISRKSLSRLFARQPNLSGYLPKKLLG